MSKKNNKSKNNYFKGTPLNRAIFGYEAQISNNEKYFFSFEYISNLIKQESLAIKSYSKIFAAIFFMNSLTLFYMKGVQFDLTIFGVSFDKIPASSEIICLILGLNIFSFSVQSLDITIFARMRYTLINKLLGTDLVNIELAHLKNNGLWIDLITPRFIGYSSGKIESFIYSIYSKILSIFIVSIFLASSYSLLSIYIFVLKSSNLNAYSFIISLAGLVIGVLGVIIFVISQYVPFKFILPIAKKLEDITSNALLKG